ncbi:MAG: hypothetical protein AB7I59_13250 [Geminicoccaceae bacterium]
MSAWSLVFDPHLPWWALAALALLALAVTALAFWRRAGGAVWRAVFLGLLLIFLVNPILRREERAPLDDLVVMLSDRSPSQTLRDRPAQLAEAEAALRERIGRMPGVELRELGLEGESRQGSRLFTRLREALGSGDRARLGAVIALTDGQAHDAPADPATLDLPAPLHVLLTGRPDESDRQLAILKAPSFGVVGEPQVLQLRVDDASPTDGSPVPGIPVTVRQDGKVVRELSVLPGQPTEVPFTLDKAGNTVLEVEAAARPDELTTLNNRATVQVSGVRDRLRVLVVSGQPYPGLRVWRNLLKADPAVDLVHFTILRPPEKQDGTPIRELALIAFPSRELFEVKLKEFDLIIFDNYSRRGLLPLIYLENIARYVEEGGALLEAAGPQFSEPMSLYRTPLARVLPGRPTGETFERGFRPVVTEAGQHHPVTAGLRGEGEPEWGRWFRQLDVETDGGQVLMTGVSDRPLLVLKRVGEGRVAQLLSDHAWLWARGFEGGGPQALLLRRLVHWLMKEPQLEEEQLRAITQGDEILVERQSLTSQPVAATVTAPSGAETTLRMTPDQDGVARGRFTAAEDGVYRITTGDYTAYASPRPIAPVELADMRASPNVMAPAAEVTGGTVRWLSEEGVPELRPVEPGRRAFGRGWLGVERHGAYRVTGTTETTLLPAWLALFLLLAAATTAWWREGRG